MACKRADVCMHGVISFILIDLIMQHDYFQKRKQTNLLRVSVKLKHLLICYCKLLKFDMQHDHILKKKSNFIFIWEDYWHQGQNLKKNIFLIWSSGGPFVQRSRTICAILVKGIIRNNSVKLF